MITEAYRCVGDKLERVVKTGTRSSKSALKLDEPSLNVQSPDHAWWQSTLRGVEVDVEFDGLLTSIDLFCGVGGLTLGASLASQALGLRLDPVACIDTDLRALEVYRHNFGPKLALQANIAAIIDYHAYGRGDSAQLAYSPEILADRLQVYSGAVDLLLAGPPCQGYSNLNNHSRRNDPRNQLYVCAAAVAVALRTRMVIIENVPDILADKTNVVATADKILRDAGYHVSQVILKASDFGAAQLRRRHFMIATLNPHTSIDLAMPNLEKEAMTLEEVIGDLAEVDPKSIMDEVPKLSSENKARIDYLFDRDLYDLPNEVRPMSHRNGHTYPSVYGRLQWDRPSQTITTGFMTPGRGRYIHPSVRRVITPREAARIQGFPDSFCFSPGDTEPSRKSLGKWIGDAVPTQLGYVATLIALTGM